MMSCSTKIVLLLLISVVLAVFVVYRTYISGDGNTIGNLASADIIDLLNNVTKKFLSFRSTNTQQDTTLIRYYEKLCEIDLHRQNKLKQINLNHDLLSYNKFSPVYAKEFENLQNQFHEFIQDPDNSICKEMKRFGGHYNPKCKYTDGAKFVCMDELLRDIENNECLIYSFGIGGDWTFEDMMDGIGCKVYAFDPTVNDKRNRGNNIIFEKIGVAAEPEEQNQIKTLNTILNQNGHTSTKISYLKMDIEGAEVNGLPSWFNSGALKHVRQIGFEFHLTNSRNGYTNDLATTIRFLETLKLLYFEGNYRLISYDPNGCSQNMGKPSMSYYNLAEVVLMKIDTDLKCNNDTIIEVSGEN